jgi:hypothetical protein
MADQAKPIAIPPNVSLFGTLWREISVKRATNNRAATGISTVENVNPSIVLWVDLLNS